MVEYRNELIFLAQEALLAVTVLVSNKQQMMVKMNMGRKLLTLNAMIFICP